MIRGVVLAGGASSRMGRDKARVGLHGWPAASWLAGVLRAGGCDRVELLRRTPDGPWSFPEEAWVPEPGAPLPERLEPPAAIRHPLWGVAAALADGPALLAAVDLVTLPPAGVRRLLDAGPGAVATDPDDRHALLVYGAAPGEAAALAAAGAPFRAWLAGLRRVVLPAEWLADRNRSDEQPPFWATPRALTGEAARRRARGILPG